MISKIGSCVIPVIILIIIVYGIIKKVNIFSCFTDGGREGIENAVRLAPTLVGLICAVTMLSASGAFEMLTSLAAPLADKLGFPAEVIPLFAVRPFSGSGALAVCREIIEKSGAESTAGKVASILMGSSETTFYATAVYFSSVGITSTRHTIPCALLADFSAFVFSVLAVNLGVV